MADIEDTSHIAQYIQPTATLHRIADQLLAGIAGIEINHRKKRLGATHTAQLCHCLCQALGIHIRQRQCGACFAKGEGSFTPEATACAGDQYHFSVEILHCYFSCLWFVM